MNQIEFNQHLRNAITFYYQNGIQCVPVRLERDNNGKKKPPEFRHKWRNSITLNHSLWGVDKFECTGIALKTGSNSNLLIVDIDTPIEDGLKAFKDNGIKLPESTLRAVSQSGGVHYYFRFDTRLNDRPTTIEKIFGDSCQVDIRGEGGLIYAEPTYVVNGGQYSFIGGQIQPLPESLVQFLLNRPVSECKSINQSTKRIINEWVSKPIDDRFEPIPENEIRNMLSAITANGTTKLDYRLWLKVCNAIWHSIGYCSALPILQAYMPENQIGEYYKKYDSKYDTVTVGTLIWLAKQHGYHYKPKFKNKKVGIKCNVEK